MATIQATDIADLVTTTLKELGKMKFSDNMSSYQNTIAFKRLFKQKKTVFDSGQEMQFNRMTGVGSSFRFVGLGAQDVVNMTDNMGTGKMPWTHMTWNWAFDFREPLMNSGASKIVDLLQTRRIGEMGSVIIGTERAFWRAPAVTDTTTMVGLPYFIVKSNTAVTTNDGFNGTVPSGYTTVANINPTTDLKWRNYATQYTSVTKDDLIRKMRRMAKYTDFMPLVDDVPQYDLGDDKAWYTNYAVEGTMVEILESQNDNLGTDVAPYEGSATFKRAKIMSVKELDLDTTNPVYSVDWSVLGIKALRGAWMKETVKSSLDGQHTVAATFTDCTCNLFCVDRRKLGVLATNTGVDY
jgi:hypothetical protein